jgi:hypothetical protein
MDAPAAPRSKLRHVATTIFTLIGDLAAGWNGVLKAPGFLQRLPQARPE